MSHNKIRSRSENRRTSETEGCSGVTVDEEELTPTL